MAGNEILEGGADASTQAVHGLTQPPDSLKSEGSAAAESEAISTLTSSRSTDQGMEAGATIYLQATPCVSPPPDLVDAIRLNYRLAKSAEAARIAIDQKLVSFIRVYLTAWTPSGTELTREAANKQALRVLETVRRGAEPEPEDMTLVEVVSGMVLAMEPAREGFEKRRKEHRKAVEKGVERLPIWTTRTVDAIEPSLISFEPSPIASVRGLSSWGLGAIIGEAGNLTAYSGVRKLYKRLGLAPDDCYPRGEKSAGRMIPRMARGRIMGVIADPLLRAQWRGEREDVPAHAIGPFGKVYGETKARHLEAGKKPGHADKIARRAMVKALLHDVHRAWHGLPLDYVGKE